MPSGFRGSFASLNETFDQSSGVDRANRRHPRQTDPKTKAIGNFTNASYVGVSMERKKMWEEISGGNLRIKGSIRAFNQVWWSPTPSWGSWVFRSSSMSSHLEKCAPSLASSADIWGGSRFDSGWIMMSWSSRSHVGKSRIFLIRCWFRWEERW